jgi:hypothetical protein
LKYFMKSHQLRFHKEIQGKKWWLVLLLMVSKQNYHNTDYVVRARKIGRIPCIFTRNLYVKVKPKLKKHRRTFLKAKPQKVHHTG